MGYGKMIVRGKRLGNGGFEPHLITAGEQSKYRPHQGAKERAKAAKRAGATLSSTAQAIADLGLAPLPKR